MKRRIALVITSLSGGGAEKVVLLLARTLRRLGHAADVLVVRSRADYDLSAAGPVHVVPGGDGPPLGRVRLQARALERLLADLERRDGQPFDLVVSNLVAADAVVARCRLDLPVVHVVHASVEAELAQARRRGPLRWLRERRRFAVLRGRHLVAVSRGLADELRRSPLLRPASVRTIYNPLDVEEVRRLARGRPDAIPPGPYLIHVGRAARQKRHDVLLEAFRRVPEPYRLVLLAGNDHKLPPLVRRFSLTERVVIPGFQQNPYPWIANAELLVLCSDFEGLSMACLEALALGTPVVATDCRHGPREVLGEALAEWLVPPGDPEALAQRINRALAARVDVGQPPILGEVDAEVVARRYLELVG